MISKIIERVFLKSTACRRGQVALYLLMVLVAVFLLALLNVDTFLSVRGKNRLQNGGDAAAIAAAAKQGELLNRIGKLNLEHISAAVLNDERRCVEIESDQRRLALLGPLDALRLANEAAKKNGMEVRAEFSKILQDHVNDVRTLYAGGGDEGEPYPESWPGAWTEYATELQNVIAEGLATGPDNVEFYDAAGGHMLLHREFYRAIDGENWCWFHFNCENLLNSYQSYHDWDALPRANENSMENSEVFSLHVSARKGALTDVFTFDEIIAIMRDYAGQRITAEDLTESYLVTNANQVWFWFDTGTWRKWSELSPFGDDGGFPIVGEVKPEYDVRGAAAICRCEKLVDSIALDTSTDFTWAAAAKPFGTLETADGVGPVTSLSNFIVPCFRQTRLVALDAVGGEDLATADFGWVTHVRKHLGSYLVNGPHRGDCWYCNCLATWEHDSFRSKGVRWLKYNKGGCVRPTGGSYGHGGTSHGH